MKLIDKDALVAEIEKRIKETESMQPKFDQFWAGQISAFKGVLKILDTLEVKEVQEETISKDLEEAAREWLKPKLDKSYINYGESKMMELTHFDGYAMLDATEFGAQWQKEQLIEKMCVFLESTDFYKYYNREFIKEFKKAMEK
jgi:hypothetical protein